MAELFGRGIILGFAIAAPVGPIGLLCIRRTLAGGRLAGMMSGLGAASADAFYGSLAAFGLAGALTWLSGWQPWLRLVGGAFVLWLGVQAVRTPAATEAAPGSVRSGLARAYFSTLLLTLSNPMTILSFLAVFAGLGLAPGGQRWDEAAWLVLGVFSGSSLWWLLLSSGVHLLRQRLRPAWLAWVNLAAGAGLVLIGLGMVAGVVREWTGWL